MCGVMLAMIIFVLELFKFPVTLNSFTRFPSDTNFIFAALSYGSSSSCCCSLTAAGPCCCSLASYFVAVGSSLSASFSSMSFSVSCPYTISSIILFYNKEAISRTLCSLSASASRVTSTGTDTALYNFEIAFLKNVFIFYHAFLRNFFENFMDTLKQPLNWYFKVIILSM